MMYLLRHTNRNFFGGKFKKALFIFSAAIILFATLNIFDSTSFLVSNSLSPFFRSGGYFYEKISPLTNIFSDKNRLIKENEELSQKIENMKLDLLDYESLSDENRKLREELGLRPSSPHITARVIGKPPQIPLDSLLVDRGQNDFIDVGSLVLARDKFLIGKIAKVFSNKATVALNSFPEATLYGHVARTDEPLEIVGAGGGGMQARVSIDFDIQLGDKVMVEGGSTFIAAIVASIEGNEPSGFKNVLLSLPADISKTEIIFIEPVVAP